jgi:hypothetical protein
MTEDQKKEALDLYKHGVRVKAIHQLIGSSDNEVKRYLYKVEGMALRNTKHRINTLDKIRRARLQGMQMQEIVDTLHLTKNQVNYLLRKAGTSLKGIDRSRGK